MRMFRLAMVVAALALVACDEPGGNGGGTDVPVIDPGGGGDDPGGGTDPGGGEDPGGPTDPGGQPDDNPWQDVNTQEDASGWSYGMPCEAAELIGYFDVGHYHYPDYSYPSLVGEVADGVYPLTVLQEVLVEGECRLMRKENPFCETPCEGGQVCTHGGTCVDYPVNQSVGTVTVGGLHVPVEMTPTVVNSYADTSVPLPMFDPGAVITLSGSGADLPAFQLQAWGVPELEVPSDILTLKKASPTTVTWTPTDGPGRIHMTLNVDQHGNSPVTMICTVDDTGSYELSGELVTALLEYGVSGFATFDMYRRTVDSTQVGPGCVELRVFSFVPGKIKVEGHVPCFNDVDCPPGETCNIPTNTCVGG